MQIFGIDLWRVLLCAVLLYIVVMRANIVAMFASSKYMKQDYNGALRLLKTADKIGNLNAKNKRRYGYLLLRCGDFENAMLQFRNTLPMTKREGVERYELKILIALAYWKLGNLEEAIEEMEEILEKGYKNTKVYQNLGILYNLADDKERAKKFCLEAYEYNKDDNSICDNLADIYAQCGEYEKAAELYEELVNRTPEPSFPEAYYGYGKVLAELGDKQRGVEMIEKSLTKNFSALSVHSKKEVEELLFKYKNM